MEIHPIIDPYAIHYDSFAGDVYTIDTASITLTAGTLSAEHIISTDDAYITDRLGIGTTTYTERLNLTDTTADAATKMQTGLTPALGSSPLAWRPGSASEGTITDNGYPWTNPTNITNGGSADCTINEDFSDDLRAYNFGFDSGETQEIPADATIVGIMVTINRKASDSEAVRDFSIKLVDRDGSVVGDNKADTGTLWPDSATGAEYGGSSDMWGTSLTAADIRDSDFGVDIEIETDTEVQNETGYVNWVKIQVYYTRVTYYTAGIDETDLSYKIAYNSALGGTDRFTIDPDGNVGIGTATPTTALQMGNDKLIAFDVDSGLTASTTQTQGQGALTAQVNEISVVANKDDTVTLPSAITGIAIEIINNGVNTLQIFPASGDDLGLGVNTAEELEANESVKFVAYDTTNWAKESTTEIIHAEIHDEDNTDAFVINDAGGDFHSYHTNALAAGDLANWTFDAGGAGTSHAITGIAAAGGDITVTTGDAHGLAVGDIISQTNLANAAYVGVFDVLTVPTTTTYTVTATYTATGTGTMDQAATLEADAVAAGVYSFSYCISATLVGNNETFDFQLYKEATAITGSKVRRKFGAANDFGSSTGCGVVSIASGDKISLALSNEDSAANIIFRNLTIVLIRL